MSGFPGSEWTLSFTHNSSNTVLAPFPHCPASLHLLKRKMPRLWPQFTPVIVRGSPVLSPQFRILSASENLSPGFALKATTLSHQTSFIRVLGSKIHKIFLYLKMFCFFSLFSPRHPPPHFLIEGGCFKSITTQSNLSYTHSK